MEIVGLLCEGFGFCLPIIICSVLGLIVYGVKKEGSSQTKFWLVGAIIQGVAIFGLLSGVLSQGELLTTQIIVNIAMSLVCIIVFYSVVKKKAS